MAVVVSALAFARVEKAELRRGLEREPALGIVLDQRGNAVEDRGALAAAHLAAARGKLLALHAECGAALRAARGEAHRATPVRSAQPSRRRGASSSNRAS